MTEKHRRLAANHRANNRKGKRLGRGRSPMDDVPAQGAGRMRL
ncbi:MAG: hypothetical protein OXU54_00385 [Gammaproteobacteria bacterium]|nr:hypothetical protein [Gammaproteobacteria bacterium]